MSKCPPTPALVLERRPCEQCWAETAGEAETRCKATQGIDGDYHCAGADCPEDDAGYLLFPTAASLAAQDAWYDVHHSCFEGCVARVGGSPK